MLYYNVWKWTDWLHVQTLTVMIAQKRQDSGPSLVNDEVWKLKRSSRDISRQAVAVCGCVLFIRSGNTLCKRGNRGSVWSLLCYTRWWSKRRCRKTWAKHNALLSAQKKSWSWRLYARVTLPSPCLKSRQGGMGERIDSAQGRSSQGTADLHCCSTSCS